jgi:hypothetical protein
MHGVLVYIILVESQAIFVRRVPSEQRDVHPFITGQTPAKTP